MFQRIEICYQLRIEPKFLGCLACSQVTRKTTPSWLQNVSHYEDIHCKWKHTGIQIKIYFHAYFQTFKLTYFTLKVHPTIMFKNTNAEKTFITHYWPPDMTVLQPGKWAPLFCRTYCLHLQHCRSTLKVGTSIL
jgi:hypothetical protein